MSTAGIIEIIKKAAMEACEAAKPVAVLYGKVIKTSPLTIDLEQKVQLTEDFLILTKNVMDYKINLDIATSTDTTNLVANINNETVDLAHKHNVTLKTSITVNNALKLNDKVILMQIQGGQKYVVLDKVN